MIERVDSQLKKEISEIVNNEIGDPRIDVPVSIFEADCSRDLSYAKVYVRAYGTADLKELVKALNNASSYIRNLLFKRMKIRTVPKLNFVADESLDNGFRIDELIKSIEIKDNE